MKPSRLSCRLWHSPDPASSSGWEQVGRAQPRFIGEDDRLNSGAPTSLPRANVRLAARARTGRCLAFGFVWGIDAVLKWLPRYRHPYLDPLKAVAQGQPGFPHGWFHFWVTLQSGSPAVRADLTGVAETSIALVLLLGSARRPGYLLGAGYMLLVWAVGEGFGGSHSSGAIDVGTGILYTQFFLYLFVSSPSAAEESLRGDRVLVARDQRERGWPTSAADRRDRMGGGRA